MMPSNIKVRLATTAVIALSCAALLSACATNKPTPAAAAPFGPPVSLTQAIDDAQAIISGAQAPCTDTGNAADLLNIAQAASAAGDYAKAQQLAKQAADAASTALNLCYKSQSQAPQAATAATPVPAPHHPRTHRGKHPAEVPAPPPASNPAQQEAQTVDEYVKHLKWANFAWHAPESMAYCEVQTVTLVLASNDVATLRQLETAAGAPAPAAGTTTAAAASTAAAVQMGTGTVRLANSMTATLSSPQGDFVITALRDESQTVTSDQAYSWQWQIVPTHFGNGQLELKITTNEAPSYTHAPLILAEHTETIKINVTSGGVWCRSVHFVGSNWQWFVGALILTPLGWLLKRWFDKRASRNVGTPS